ncbi:glycosyltransferase [Candidatus Omnitrophota bacterium]
MQNPLVSIIIPCKSKNVVIDSLLDDISLQEESFDAEIIRIDGIKPPGRARNVGAEKARGSIFVFIDSDIRLGNDLFLANLIKPLIEKSNIGMTCASHRIPPYSSGFQILYARQVPHSESPVVDVLTDVQVASSACCAIRREVFLKIGGFHEDVARGEDSILSFQLIKESFRVALVPNTWCYHPQPRGIAELMGTSLRNGMGACHVDIFYPHLNLDVHPKGVTYFSEKKNIFQRVNRFLLGWLDSLIQAKIILFLYKIFYIFGYATGFLRYKILKCKG